MAKRRAKYIRHSIATKLAAVQARIGGEPIKEVTSRYRINNALLYNWIAAYKDGKLGDPPAASEPKKAANSSLQDVYNERVRRAIVLLRQAEDEVERLKKQGKLKEADTAHLHAQLALRILQGDNGR